MKSLTLLVLAIAGVGATSQVNFYYDNKCQNYAGHRYIELGQITGGPSGARSMLFVDDNDDCYGTCGPNLIFCKNAACNAWDVASRTGACKHFENGVWATKTCGCYGCTEGCSGRL
ncbi:hypothetical protein BDW59DRAFT_165013 [Aspergillus cavernicola]|uniref:Uncharacterized protein n=1 Tax=Aspergillus cavernicola TaxID=176166 RepID=A0ABR4HVP1_9EURO